MLVLGGGGCELFLVVDAAKVPKADLLNCGVVLKCPANAQIKSTASFGNFTGVWLPGFSNIPTGVCLFCFQHRPVLKSCETYEQSVLIAGGLTFFERMTNTKSLQQTPPSLFLPTVTPSRICLIDGIAGH